MFKRNTKITATEKAELKKEILKVTPVTVLPKTKPVAQPKMSPKAQALAKVLENFPGDWRGHSKGKALQEAFEAILGEKVVFGTPVSIPMSDSPRIDKANLLKFQAIVPEGVQGDPSVVGKVVLLNENGGSFGLKADGNLSNVTRSYCRYATRAEIDTFLAELQKNASADVVARNLGF